MKVKRTDNIHNKKQLEGMKLKLTGNINYIGLQFGI